MSFSRSLTFTAALLFATVMAAQESRQPLPPIPTAPTSAPVSASSAAAASMRGTIADPDQAVIPGATITLTPPKGKAIVVQSGADGTYEIKDIPNGTYNITVTMPGFATVVKQNVKFSTGQVMTMNVKMAIEEQATEVSVTTTSNQVSVDQDNNASAMVIKGKDLDALSDDPDELQSELSALAGPAAGPNGGQIYVDGFTGGSLPPKSSIREIRVNQNPFTAQYEHPGYGRIEVLTKPGTDVFHGSAMIMGNHSALNTSSPFLDKTNEFPSYFTVFTMGSISGPLSNHISFNLNGSYRDIEENTIITGRIVSKDETPNVLCAPGTGDSTSPTYDPACKLREFPAQFRANPNPRKRGEISPRLDFALGEKNTMSVRYQFEGGPSRNSGPGNLVLPTNAYNSNNTEHRIQIADSWIVSPKVVNENRFEYRREESSRTSQNNAPTLNVSGTFNGGGNSNNNDNVSSRFEYQNYTSIALTKNFVRMGARLRYYRSHLTSTSGANGTYTYSGIEGVGDGSAAAAYLLNRPSQFSITNVNVPTVSATIADLGLYLEDDWKVMPNLTLTGGVRYETQSQIHSAHDIAPRVSLAWGIPRKNGSPVTVIRAGAGVFYDRFDVDEVLTKVRQNGTNQVQTIYTPPLNPTLVCAPGQPISNCGSGSTGSATKYVFAPNLRSEYNLQFALGVDQQLAKNATLSVNFISSNGNHAYLSRAFGTPDTGYEYRFTSAGMYRQQQVIANVKWNPSSRFSLFSYYVFSHALSNTDGATSFATDSSNRFTDYGRAQFNRTHRVVLFGNTTLPWNISMSPILVASSGSPYDIIVGKDINKDSLFNDRAAFAVGHSADCRTYGDFLPPGDPAYDSAGYDRIPSNYCSTPAYFNLNLRVTKSFGFGAKREVPGSGSGDSSRGRSRGSSGGGRHGSHGMFFGGGGSSNHRYNFNLGAQAFNLFNVVPYGTPQNSLANHENFGKPLNISSSGFGSSAVRRIMLQLSFNF